MTQVEIPLVRILLLDDEPFIRNTLKRMMLKTFDNVEIREGGDGTEGLKLLEEGFDPDLALCDIQMVPMDGMTFLQKTRASGDPARVKMPVIILAGAIDAEIVRVGDNLRPCSYLPKPVSMAGLTEHLTVILRDERNDGKFLHRRAAKG